MIPFNQPPLTGCEEKHVVDSIQATKMSGDGPYSQKCHIWFEQNLPCKKALLTTSCTHSLELAAILIGIEAGDEVIMPSYTFVSTANAFVLRGARIVFVDIRPDTQNIDERLIEQAITAKTKAIVPVHYAGVACEMDEIMAIAHKYNLYVVEDAAQGMMSTYKGRALGTIGHIGAYSFHETKNYSSGGEGGLLIVNDEALIERSEIIREKGTNRSQFFRGMVDKYSWVDIGSSYLLNDLSAAFLWGQLEKATEIKQRRLEIFNAYQEGFAGIINAGLVSEPKVPPDCCVNGHMYYLRLNSLDQRSRFIDYLKAEGVMSVFHYIPLHSSIAGKQYGRFDGEDRFTTNVSNTLVRLPIFYNMDESSVRHVVATVLSFFHVESF